jgi:hypothetical protein
MMTSQEYNEKLLLTASIGNLSLEGVLYAKYGDAFREWFGEPFYDDGTSYDEDSLYIDFYEWLISRVLYDGEFVDEYTEILVEDLEEEIQSALVRNS